MLPKKTTFLRAETELCLALRQYGDLQLDEAKATFVDAAGFVFISRFVEQLSDIFLDV